ncbi:MAG: hypothetical protein A2X67_13680 [Ignavibacteria bacterium GWA2_55_11]|nr:MAG: hypothetical protein A2X67_13680 [Ignavibacteria bacterium GWA2_55_11]OGU47031.1 MAG: hypothetical protein A2X68_08590 [Ignavibacteria bacterium GWC2_56_12]OGU67707.1 MAG: hypothetical protein A3C56_03840 [Ignavibacteria bacterium RIFCSPHIGHO2_02_FULL_56_12]OGU75002.1 MAG: hypothetical protein A3G43_08105 [Ignavibacteria bacterium RIFCSPLOWO2_12_FULL_56_21]HAV24244.1 hypothetical protein [Bacteroidota bacterium]
MHSRTLPYGLLLCAAAMLPAAAQRVHKEFPLTNERELVVIVDVSFGTLVFERGPKGMAAVVEFEDREDHEDRLQVTYDADVRGKLRIKSKKSSRVWDRDEDGYERRIVVKCSYEVPLSIELELGAGKGELDMTGLQVQDLRVSTGASDVKLWCNQLNPILAEQVDIESGVSKFTAENLSNLNFRKLKFSGGVGSYNLDFGGRLQQDAEASIEVGLGAIVVNVPTDIDARLSYDDNWFSQFTLSSDFSRKKSGVYETEGYGDSRHRLNLKIDSGLGSVKIRRR